MHVERLLPANLCLVNLLSSEFVQIVNISQFERFLLQPIQMVNKTCSVKTKLIGNNDEGKQS